MAKKKAAQRPSSKTSPRRTADKKHKQKTSSKKGIRKVPKPKGPLFARLYLRGAHLAEISAVRELRTGYPPDSTRIQLHNEIHHGSADNPNLLTVKLTVAIRSSNSNEPASHIALTAKHEIIYESDGPLPDKLSEKDGHAISALGTFAAWPYVRELVSSTTSRMGLPGMLLPSLRGNIAEGQIELAVSTK